MPELPEALLDEAAQFAIYSEVAYARANRQAVFVVPERAQVKRLIVAAWPILTAPDETSDDGG